MGMRETLQRIASISRRELRLFAHRPLFLFCMIIAPVVCAVFYTTLMGKGLPTDLPAGLVDEDNTHISHIMGRTIDALEMTDIVAHYTSFAEARHDMQRGRIYAFFYIPKGTTERAIANRQPRISFYTNESYLLPGNLLMKDMLQGSVLTGLALTRENLYARGYTEDEAMGVIQPIVIETHPLNNSYLNYSVYLNNIILPGILILLVMLSTTYTIGWEWKMKTHRRWYEMAGHSSAVALTGKLLPQTLLFSCIVIFYDVLFYRFLQFPCNCGILFMMLLGVITVLASQAFGIFLFGAFTGQMRLSMCLCSLWGILSFSITGFTYPVTAMDGVLQVLSWLFPLRHYYMIYVNSALNGFSIHYVWPYAVALLLFLILPLIVLPRYRVAFLRGKYKP